MPSEPLFYVWNDTDGLMAHPEPMPRAQCLNFIAGFRQRFARQGYYASASGRLPIAEVKLRLEYAGSLPKGEVR